jgi:hypothetical protein
MDKYICIHGHFYQPQRANPWLETIELQGEAYPWHDWNEKINAECYMVNGGAHLLDSQNRLIRILNNYSRISFNFGPTLLSWIKMHDRKTHASIVNADIASRSVFSGHGSAIAQIYNHIIMPLASRQDKIIEVAWAVSDFEANFGRKPEGIWLSETAVDTETLEVCADFGIKFTVLSPNQAKAVRKITKDPVNPPWLDVSDGSVNTRMPYICELPEGRSINIFFYDDAVSSKVSFGDLLKDGETFAKSITGLPPQKQELPEIISISSDGETYGHHHQFGEMALSYCIDYIESKKLAKITVFGEYLQMYPPLYEVRIIENSSWSCSHGIGRWKDDCGCATGSENHPEFNQKWRAPLREAIDWLAAINSSVYTEQVKRYLKPDISNPDEAIKSYISIMDNRTGKAAEKYFSLFLKNPLEKTERIVFLKLLEAYRQSLFMQSSDAWFFDDISRIESIQIMRHACRAMEILTELTGRDFESQFLKILKKAKSNRPEYGDGESIYLLYAKKASCDFVKISARLALEILVSDKKEISDIYNIYSFEASEITYDTIQTHNSTIITGSAAVISKLTLESKNVIFAAYRHKNSNILSSTNTAAFAKIAAEDDPLEISSVNTQLRKLLISANKQNDDVFTGYVNIGSDPSAVKNYLVKRFAGKLFTISDFVKDEQLLAVEKMMASYNSSIYPQMANILNEYEETLNDFKEKKMLNYFLDGIFPNIYEFFGEYMLYNIIKKPGLSQKDIFEMNWISEKIGIVNLINLESLGIISTKKLEETIESFSIEPENTELLKNLAEFFDIIKKLKISLNIWKSQNVIFEVKENIYSLKTIEAKTNSRSKTWLLYFEKVMDHLNIFR